MPPRWTGDILRPLRQASLDEDSTEMTDVRVIFEQNPPSQTPKHYGSRIVFGPDGMPYITTGEHSIQADRVLAQDITTTYCKVIRISPEGDVPDYNPFVGTRGWTQFGLMGTATFKGLILPLTGRCGRWSTGRAVGMS